MKVFGKAKPNAKEERVVKIDDANFEVCVKEPPRQGKANDAIARALAEYFGIAHSRVRIVSGFSSRRKVFKIFEDRKKDRLS